MAIIDAEDEKAAHAAAVDSEQQHPDTGDLRQDPLLNLVVGLGRGGIGLGVTLCVGGITVAGDVVGAKQFFDELATRFEKPAPGESKGAVAFRQEIGPALREIGDVMKTNWERHENDEARNRPPPTFIQLRNAVVFAANTQMNVGLWRGRLDRVDGFALGRPE